MTLNQQIEPDSPFTEAQLVKIQQVLRRNLPQEYWEFAKKYGGAFVGGAVDGDDELPILVFFNAEKLLKSLELHNDLKDEGMLPIARCELGNLWVIDRDDSIYYINYYGGKTVARRVADNFSDFLSRLTPDSD